MTSLTVSKLDDAARDLQTLDDIANSEALTTTTRSGEVVRTRAGLEAEYPDAAANAAVAVANAAIAVSQAQAAAGSAAAASESQAAAANYAAVSATGAKFYDTIALGLAGVVDGQTFGVKAGGTDGLLRPTIYRRDSAAAFTSLAALIAGAEYDAVLPRGYSRTGYLIPFLGSLNRLLGGFKSDGTFWNKGLDIYSSLVRLLAALPTGPQRSNYLIPFLDSANRILGGFLKNGELEVKGVNISQALLKVPTAVSYTQPSTNIAAGPGDSLTEGTGAGGNPYWQQLQALYSGAGDTRTVLGTGMGFGGQNCDSILARQGPVPALVSLPVGASGFPEIPAAGAVNVTVTKAPLSYADATQTKSITGTLAGIHGTLTKAANTGQYSFTRDTAGSVIVTDPAIPFVPDTASWRFMTFVCWIGTNNILSSTPQQVLAYIGQFLSWQATTQKRRVIIMPAINCLDSNVATIKANYAGLLALVKEAYAYEYVDLLSLLQRHNDGSANDLADVAAGLPPRSLLYTDRYHLNATGYGFVAAEIKRILDSKGF